MLYHLLKMVQKAFNQKTCLDNSYSLDMNVCLETSLYMHRVTWLTIQGC